MVYLREDETLADQLALFRANPSKDTAKEMRSVAARVLESARKAIARVGSSVRSVGPLLAKARLLAVASMIGRPDRAQVAKRLFETTVEHILRLSPRHTAVINLAWAFL